MGGGDLELGQLLAAAEAAPPGESVEVVANDLRKRFGAERVSSLFVPVRRPGGPSAAAPDHTGR